MMRLRAFRDSFRCRSGPRWATIPPMYEVFRLVDRVTGDGLVVEADEGASRLVLVVTVDGRRSLLVLSDPNAAARLGAALLAAADERPGLPRCARTPRRVALGRKP
jgi:hypothetical protein